MSAAAFQTMSVRWVWSLYGVVLTRPPGIHADGAAATLEAAKAEFGATVGVALPFRPLARLAQVQEPGGAGGEARGGRGLGADD
jgi:hypothetical protein